MKRYRHYNKDLAIVLSCFGSVIEQQKYINLQQKLSQHFDTADIFIAFQSRMVLKLLAKEDKHYKNLIQTLADVDMLGYKNVIVSSINLFPTDEHNVVKSIVKGFGEFCPSTIACTDAIFTKTKYTTQAIIEINNKFEDAEYANLYIIHGTPKLDTQGIYSIDYVSTLLTKINSNNICFSLEGSYPYSVMSSAIIQDIKSKNLSKVRLIPLLLVSGNHYEKDVIEIQEELSEHFDVQLAYPDKKFSLIEEECILDIITKEIKEQIKKVKD